MGPAIAGTSEERYRERLGMWASKREMTPDVAEKTFIERGLLVGTPDRIAEQIAALEEAGVQRVYLQWLDLDDLEGMRDTVDAVRGT
jgi:alkanesulfonate monooxygenase SsuD/methylene tetrahydromethanopterin reductase-like flavin-dependent oxidoreductase (luciferase family)